MPPIDERAKIESIVILFDRREGWLVIEGQTRSADFALRGCSCSSFCCGVAVVVDNRASSAR